MATKTPKAAAAAAPAIAPARVTIWGWTRNAARVTGKPQGLMQVTADVAAALIASGDAVAATGRARYPYREGFEPFPMPPTPPDIIVAITAISAANPALATLSAADVTKLTPAAPGNITVSGATGAGAAAINKAHSFVLVDATTIQLTDLDNSAPLVFAGYPLTGITRAPAPAPAPAPAAAPAPETEPATAPA